MAFLTLALQHQRGPGAPAKTESHVKTTAILLTLVHPVSHEARGSPYLLPLLCRPNYVLVGCQDTFILAQERSPAPGICGEHRQGQGEEK